MLKPAYFLNLFFSKAYTMAVTCRRSLAFPVTVFSFCKTKVGGRHDGKSHTDKGVLAHPVTAYKSFETKKEPASHWVKAVQNSEFL